jgi:hypothetical protein
MPDRGAGFPGGIPLFVAIISPFFKNTQIV